MTEALVGVFAVVIGIGMSVLVAVEGARLKDALAPLAFVGFGVVWLLVMTNIRELRHRAAR